MAIKEIRNSPFDARLAFIVILAGVLLRFALASITIEGGDPCYHLSAAKFVGTNFRLPSFDPIGREVFAHEPLFHIFAGMFYFIFEKVQMGDFGMHLVSPIFGSLSLILIYFIARKLFDSRIALYSAIFAAFIPLNVYHSTTAHIDMAAAFFVLLSVFFMIMGKFHLSAIAFGLSVLGRINSIFIAPFLIFMAFRLYSGKRIFYRLISFFLIALLIVSPWYARNYTLLHNPVWPFMNSFFGGYYSTSHDLKPDKIGHILDLKDAYAEVFLALFGVPDGKYGNLFLFKSTILNFAIAFWAIFAIISLLPVLFWLFSPLKHKNVSLVLCIALPFLFFLYFYQYSYGNTSTRYILPAIPFLGILWALGTERISRLAGARLIAIFLVLFILVFSASESIKTGIITLQWKELDKDFEWAHKNIPSDALVAGPGQCMGYRLERNYYPAKGTGYDLKPSLEPKLEEIVYIVNVDNIVQKPMPEGSLGHYLPYFEKVYENKKTNFIVYRNKLTSAG